MAWDITATGWTAEWWPVSYLAGSRLIRKNRNELPPAHGLSAQPASQGFGSLRSRTTLSGEAAPWQTTNNRTKHTTEPLRPSGWIVWRRDPLSQQVAVRAAGSGRAWRPWTTPEMSQARAGTVVRLPGVRARASLYVLDLCKYQDPNPSEWGKWGNHRQ